MGLLANSIRKVAGIEKGAPKTKSIWEPETEEESDYISIMIIAAAIAAITDSKEKINAAFVGLIYF